MRWRALALAASVLLLAAAAGCVQSTFPGGPPFVTVPNLSRAELEAAPESLLSVPTPIRASVYMWRDFMPSSPPGGRPLIAVVRLTAPTEAVFPAGIEARYLWVLSPDAIWRAALVLENPNITPPNAVETVARNGPKWGPGVTVDVVVGVRTPSDSLRLVRIKDAYINRTD
jgi:hypothetical protein